MAALKSSQDASTSAAVSQHRDWSINLGTGRIQLGPSPWLYRLDFGGTGLLTASTAIHQISTNAAARCGPITEFFNSNIGGGTDFFFWGVTRNCV